MGSAWIIPDVRQLRDAVAAWSSAGLRMVGATLVRSEGSTPHQLGLTLVTNESGETVGALSGGCVDADIVLACDRVLAGGPPEILAFGADDEEIGLAQLACGGAITVWVHELDRAAVSGILSPSDAAVLTHLAGPHVQQLSVIHSEATAYEYSGTYECSGTYACTGSPLDPLRETAANWLLRASNRTELMPAPDGGEIFLESFGRRRLFVVVGSSGYSEALCVQASLLGYESVVVEPRPRFAAGITYADEVIGSWPDVALEKLAQRGRLDGKSAVVVCTHDPKFDEPALAVAVESSAGFVGALGSRATSADRFARLRARGIPEVALRRIHAPAGLDLGGASPAETAVSVFAQIIASASGRSASPLRDTAGPLHAR